MADRLNMLMESRIHGDMYVRFGGEFLETCYRNIVRRWVLSLRLKSQYLFIFTAGLLILFILFVVMYMAGINQWSCIITGVTLSTILVRTTFYLNKRYGEHGLMKLLAKHSRPYYLINRKKVIHLLPKTKEQ